MSFLAWWTNLLIVSLLLIVIWYLIRIIRRLASSEPLLTVHEVLDQTKQYVRTQWIDILINVFGFLLLTVVAAACCYCIDHMLTLKFG